MTRVLVAGATSSLAAALIRQLAAAGHDLLLLGRDEAELKARRTDLAIRYPVAVEIAVVDVQQPDWDAKTWLAEQGDIHVAYVMLGDMGAENALDAENIAQVMNVNLTQCATMCTALAEHMSQQDEKGGVIAIVSSVAGDRGRASNFVYGAAKAGLTAFASGLRAHMAQLGSGVHVMTVKPGFIDSPATYGIESPLMTSREHVAQAMVRAVAKRRNSIYAPHYWWLIMRIIQHIPEGLFKRLKF